MKVLLDEMLPHRLRFLLEPLHEVYTTAYMGWDGNRNGVLLELAAGQAFEVLITADQGYEHQHNFDQLPCSVILLVGPGTALDDLLPIVPELSLKLRELEPKSFAKLSFK